MVPPSTISHSMNEYPIFHLLNVIKPNRWESTSMPNKQKNHITVNMILLKIEKEWEKYEQNSQIVIHGIIMSKLMF